MTVMDAPQVTVVIPARNAAATLNECLRSLRGQSLPEGAFEIIVVDDGSTDDSARMATQSGVTVLHQAWQGAPAARNAGIEAARGKWVAFTDADCALTRRWLQSLLNAVTRDAEEDCMGAAGPIHGLHSETPASRFVDLSGGLDTRRHLSHPRYPFAPTANAMYRRDLLKAVGGFDTRYSAYDACDLHLRIRRRFPELHFRFAPLAVVLHRHRPTWRAYYRQQVGYGRGYAQFMLHYRHEIQWSVARELGEWVSILAAVPDAVLAGGTEERVLARGLLLRRFAQRIGFAETYWRGKERARWRIQ